MTPEHNAESLPLESIEDRICTALEQMCFVLADPVDEVEEADLARHAQISLSDESNITKLLLSASDGFLVEAASSLLGMGPDEVTPEEDGVLILKELSNIFCGEMIDLLGGTERQIGAGLPEELESDVAHASAGRTLCFDSMGESLRIRIESNQRS